MWFDRLIGFPEVWGAHVYGDVCALVCLTPQKQRIKSNSKKGSKKNPKNEPVKVAFPAARILHVFTGSLSDAQEFAQQYGLNWKGIHVSSASLKVLWRTDPDQGPQMDKEEELRIPGEFKESPAWILARSPHVEPQNIPLDVVSYRSVRPVWFFDINGAQDSESEKPDPRSKVLLDFDGENVLCWFETEGQIGECVSLLISEVDFKKKLQYLLQWYRPGVHGEAAPEVAEYTSLVPEVAREILYKCFPTENCECVLNSADQLIQQCSDQQEKDQKQILVTEPALHWACRNALCSLEEFPSNVIGQKNSHIPARYDYWFGLYRYIMIAVILIFTALAGYSGLQAGWNAIVSRQYAEVLSQGRNNRALAESIASVQDSLEQEQGAFSDVLRARSQITSYMNEFKHVVPDSVWITQWDIRSAVNHSIQGYTTSNSKLTVFQRKLEQSPLMKSVRILESESVSPARAAQLFGVDAFPEGLVAFSIRAGSR